MDFRPGSLSLDSNNYFFAILRRSSRDQAPHRLDRFTKKTPSGVLRSPCSVGIDQNLSGFPSLHTRNGLRKIFHRDAVGDDRMQVELAALEQRGHLIPGLIHAASVDALDGDAFEDDVVREVQWNRFAG